MIYVVLIAEKYTTKSGAKETKFYAVRTAFENRSGPGFNIETPPGIAIIAKAFLRPRNDKDGKEPYLSVADQFEA